MKCPNRQTDLKMADREGIEDPLCRSAEGFGWIAVS